MLCPGYHWKNSTINGANEQRNLERLTANMLRSLSGPTMLMIGDSTSLSQLPSGDRQAYQWAINAYGADAQYRSWEDFSSMGKESTIKTIWFHKEDDPILSTESELSSSAIRDFIYEDGGGMVLSGFANQFLHVMDTNFVATNETIDKDPAGPDVAWGIRPFPSKDQHPIFVGIPYNTDWIDSNWRGFRTVSDSVAGREAISWWTGNSYPGVDSQLCPGFQGKTFL